MSNNKKENQVEMSLGYCKSCIQMTNHANGVCLKCYVPPQPQEDKMKQCKKCTKWFRLKEHCDFCYVCHTKEGLLFCLNVIFSQTKKPNFYKRKAGIVK